MNKNKGFTLIELLAVIVILAVLMVIAVPKILNVINNSKKSATDSSIKLLKDAIKTQVTSKDITNSNFEQDASGCYLFDFDDQKSGNANELKLKNKDKFTGSIKYCNGVFSDDTLKFDGNSIVSNNVNKKVICKRATKLHTEECTQTDGTRYCGGAGYTENGTKGMSTITYGNLGTKGTLKSGDAFDCDVNGDITYDPVTERFYYVSDYYNTSTKSFENDTAVLIYYNNVNTGNPDNSKLYAYDSSGENFHGPRTAIAQLPTTSQWSNISLKNTTRSILNESGSNTTNGGTLPNDFSYAGYAARFLTNEEVRRSTGNNNIPTFEEGELNNFIYLLENTRFSDGNNAVWAWWLENSDSSSSSHALDVDGHYLQVYFNNVSDKNVNGVRPAIEVSKKNIEY